jgi:hypothetical protein
MRRGEESLKINGFQANSKAPHLYRIGGEENSNMNGFWANSKTSLTFLALLGVIL